MIMHMLKMGRIKRHGAKKVNESRHKLKEEKGMVRRGKEAEFQKVMPLYK
jgi:hypothetical protein